MVRSGLEFVRLWRQYCPEAFYPSLTTKMIEFEDYSIQISNNLPNPIALLADKTVQYRKSNSTVILYFDHLFHGTPEGHVESQARIKTCLRLLKQQESGGKVKKGRAIVFQPCNDICSPPLWVLPLVHSPYYLGELWKNAEEARKDDLFVPLEFDTEWESDADEDPYEEESARPDPKNGVSFTQLQKSISIPEDIAMLGDEFSQIQTLLQPLAGDITLSREFISEQSSGRRRRSLDVHTRESTVSSHVPLSVHMRIVTPYGSGVVTDLPRSDSFVEVALDWGAKGFFNLDCVQQVRSSSLRPSSRPPGVPKVQTDGSDVRTAINALVAKFGNQTLVSDVLDIKQSSFGSYLRGQHGAVLGNIVITNYRSWAAQFNEETIGCILDPDYSVSASWLKQSSLKVIFF